MNTKNDLADFGSDEIPNVKTTLKSYIYYLNTSKPYGHHHDQRTAFKYNFIQIQSLALIDSADKLG